MSKYHDYLRVVEGLPEALDECAGAAEAAEKLLEHARDTQSQLAAYSLCLLRRRLRQIEAHFEPERVRERLERDKYRRTYITTREMSHEI